MYEEKESLWLQKEPTIGEVEAAFCAIESSTNINDIGEIVFCGYGEPTEALDVLLKTATFIKARCKKNIRLNTNGLANLINKRDITPLLKDKIDSVSISLNSSNPTIYLQNVRPCFGEEAFNAMLDFAKKCRVYVPIVTMTTVSSTITKEDEEACKELCESLGITYRIREYAQ